VDWCGPVRGTLIRFDDWYWLDTPVGPPEPRFYPVVSELLGQWARETASAGPPPQSVRAKRAQAGQPETGMLAQAEWIAANAAPITDAVAAALP